MKTHHFFLVIFFSLLLSWLSGLVIFSITPPIAKQTPDKADSIVVFTGGPMRIEQGLQFFTEGKSPYLFISGIHPDVVRKEIIAKWHGKTPLPKCCMILGRKATTTAENAIETKEWVENHDIQSIILVTSDYHMPRAMMEVRNLMPHLKIIPYAVNSYLKHQSRARLFLSEYNKSLYRWAQIRLKNRIELD